MYLSMFQNPSKKKREKERCIALIEKLQDEEKKQQEHVNRIMALLKHNKEKWFVTGESIWIISC